jgi:hypothetical protein
VTLTGADLAVRRLSKNSIPRQLIRRLEQAPPTIDVLGIGNSLVAAGFDPGEMERQLRASGQSVTAVNGALGATGIVEHLLLARLAFSHHQVGSVVYGFFDNQMAADLERRNDELIGNRSLLYYQEPEVAVKYTPFSLPDRLSFEVDRRFDLLVNRSTLWAKVELMRRRLAQIGMPKQQVNEFGRAADFSLLEAADTNAFLEQCRVMLQSQRFVAPPVADLIQLARAHGAKVYVVEMPMPSAHRRKFYETSAWNEVRENTRHAIEQLGAVYVRGSDWIGDDAMFVDNLHLSSEGSRLFTRRLAGLEGLTSTASTPLAEGFPPSKK